MGWRISSVSLCENSMATNVEVEPRLRSRRVEFLQVPGPRLLVEEGGSEGVAGQGAQRRLVESEGVPYGGEVVLRVAAEVGGVVGVDGHQQAGVQHGGEGVVGEVVDDAEADVGEG